ncbi:MAG TPA: dihydrofolate reductase family protein [Thermoplasmata archaeon]|nr:dihydrofolate reductase family protein [Thermoplasmata archaeon]
MKASVFIATSVDGFIARQDGGLDWLPANGGEPHGYEEFMATVDAIVIGRKTLETVLAYDSWPYEKKPVIALSATLTEVKVPDDAVCEIMSGPPHQIVARLEKRGVKHIYVDGGVTIRGFLEAGLIQHLTITRVPILLGSGIPLFGVLPHDIRLEHLATQSYSGGLVKSEYRILA